MNLRGQAIQSFCFQGTLCGAAGAGIDVTVKEPLSPKSPLIGLANVIITPHVAWYSEESELELKRKIAYSVGRVLNGEAVPNIVNRAVCDKLKLK